jgi:DNA-binding NtrC family response regulator
VHEVQITVPERFGGLVGTTPEMVALFAKLQRYAPTTMSILIHGETGTGKERVAQAVHEASQRRKENFVAVNCAAVADNLLEDELFGHVRGAFTGADRARHGLFVEADGGTLLFDEVGEMSSAMQAKLLRVLENHEIRPLGGEGSRKVSVRALFATHVDLRHAVNEGRFREDLYFRLAQVAIEIPPLRRRLDDFPILIEDILEQLGRPHMKVDAAGMSALRGRSWRGNVRELRTVIETALVESDGDRLMVEQVLSGTSTNPQPERLSGRYNDAKRDFDRRFYTPLYLRFDGNVTQIANAAGKQRATVLSALRALGLRAADEGTPRKET